MKRGWIGFLILLFIALPVVSAQLTADQQAAIAAAQASLSTGDQAALQNALATATAAQSNVLGFIWVYLVFGIIIGIGAYVYVALALKKIAMKTNTPKEWLAWVPVGDLWLMNKIAGTPNWSFYVMIAGFIIGFIPYAGVIGWLAVMGIFGWWSVKISTMLGKPSWWGYVMAVPFLNSVISALFVNVVISSIIGLGSIASAVLLGMLAWGKTELKSSASNIQPLLPPLTEPSQANTPLMNWIKDAQSKGYSSEDIKANLMKSGYSEIEVNSAVQAVMSQE